MEHGVSPHRHLWLLDEQITFLNHGSFGACPRVVLEEQARFREEMEREPVQFLWREMEGKLDAARAELACFAGADPEDIAFVANATMAVNAVVRSLELREGDELLTTSHAYNACNNVLAEVARRAGARVVVAKVPFPLASSDEVTAAILDAATSRTRLAMIDHVTSATALVFPVAEIVAALEARGIPVLVDGAHAPGMLPLDLRALGASWYTGNLHKWVCAPKGAAFIFARRDRQAGLHPATISHGYNTPREGRSSFHDEFDWQGTMDFSAWLCVPAAIRFCGSLMAGGHAALMRHNRQLVLDARALLAERLGVDPPCPAGMLGSMAVMPLPACLQTGIQATGRFDPLQTRLFAHHRIEVPIMRRGDPLRKWFRISAHAHNSMEDYIRLADALAEEMR